MFNSIEAKYLKKFNFILVLFICFSCQSKTSSIEVKKNVSQFRFKNCIRNNENIRDLKLNDSFTQTYMKYKDYINPVGAGPYTTFQETTFCNKNLMFKVSYDVEMLGLRKTSPSSKKSTKHLIFAGDSNMFGIGVENDETLPSYFSKKTDQYSIINLGIPASGPHSTLFFLEKIGVKNLVNHLQNGVFIYDYNEYLIPRVIGSKAFICTMDKGPNYVLLDGHLIFQGSIEDKLTTWFYKKICTLPYHQTLFPDLPRVNKSHALLVAKIIIKLKEEYLKQTNLKNRFIVSINPSYIIYDQNIHAFLLNQLIQNGVEVFTYSPEEKLPLPLIPEESHMSKIAQKNYAQMIQNKLIKIPE